MNVNKVLNDIEYCKRKQPKKARKESAFITNDGLFAFQNSVDSIVIAINFPIWENEDGTGFFEMLIPPRSYRLQNSGAFLGNSV